MSSVVDLKISADDLRPLVRQVVVQAIGAAGRFESRSDRMAYSEAEAARMLGLKAHQLRDERLRGRIGHSRIVGGRVRYSDSDLRGYLAREHTAANAAD